MGGLLFLKGDEFMFNLNEILKISSVNNGTCWMKKGSVCKANAFSRSEHVCGLVTRCEEDYYRNRNINNQILLAC